jgi:ribose transport system substrate-binding protein
MTTTYERRQTILRMLQLEENETLGVAEMAELLRVSEGTIRNDLTALQDEQLIVRVRGGAVLKNGAAIAARLPNPTRNAEAKLWIARWAADMIEDGDAIFVDASTTVLSIAPFLTDRRHLTVITNGIDIARALALNLSNTVILVGGVLRPDGHSVVGLLGEPLLSDLYIKTAFLSCVGLSVEAGLTESDVREGQLKSEIIRSAKTVVALVDSSKFGNVSLAPFATLAQVGHIVTDDQVEPASVELLRRAGIAVTICGEDTVNSLAPAPNAVKHFRIGFANLSEDMLFPVDVRRGLERAAQRSNIDLVLADNQLNSSTALTVADSLIAQHVDLVIEYQIDEGIGSLIVDKFQRAGIPLIAVDIPMVGASFFGVDNYRAGHMAGIELGKWIGREWGGRIDRVLVLEESRAGTLPAARIQGQINGLQEVIGRIPDGQIVRMDGSNTGEVSEASTEKVLEALPDAHSLAVICFNDDAALGALAAARRLGREQDMVIVGQGADRRGREEIRQPGSRIIGSTAFTPEKYGEKLIEMALKILRGEPTPPAIYVDHAFVSAANVGDYGG